jgi:hypothetical protein
MENTSSGIRPSVSTFWFTKAGAADTTIRSLMDPSGRITHWSEYGTGGHFPAMEVPDLLAGDIRAFFRDLR